MKQATGYIVLPGIGTMPFIGPLVPRSGVISGMDSLIERDAGMTPGDIVRRPLRGTNSNKNCGCMVPV